MKNIIYILPIVSIFMPNIGFSTGVAASATSQTLNSSGDLEGVSKFLEQTCKYVDTIQKTYDFIICWYLAEINANPWDPKISNALSKFVSAFDEFLCFIEEAVGKEKNNTNISSAIQKLRGPVLANMSSCIQDITYRGLILQYLDTTDKDNKQEVEQKLKAFLQTKIDKMSASKKVDLQNIYATPIAEFISTAISYCDRCIVSRQNIQSQRSKKKMEWERNNSADRPFRQEIAYTLQERPKYLSEFSEFVGMCSREFKQNKRLCGILLKIQESLDALWDGQLPTSTVQNTAVVSQSGVSSSVQSANNEAASQAAIMASLNSNIGIIQKAVECIFSYYIAERCVTIDNQANFKVLNKEILPNIDKILYIIKQLIPTAPLEQQMIALALFKTPSFADYTCAYLKSDCTDEAQFKEKLEKTIKKLVDFQKTYGIKTEEFSAKATEYCKLIHKNVLAFYNVTSMSDIGKSMEQPAKFSQVKAMRENVIQRNDIACFLNFVNQFLTLDDYKTDGLSLRSILESLQKGLCKIGVKPQNPATDPAAVASSLPSTDSQSTVAPGNDAQNGGLISIIPNSAQTQELTSQDIRQNNQIEVAQPQSVNYSMVQAMLDNKLSMAECVTILNHAGKMANSILKLHNAKTCAHCQISQIDCEQRRMIKLILSVMLCVLPASTMQTMLQIFKKPTVSTPNLSKGSTKFDNQSSTKDYKGRSIIMKKLQLGKQ